MSTETNRRDYTRLRVELRQDLVTVGIHRPDKSNALDRQMSEELGRVLEQARHGPPAVLLLYSTTPGMFVSGADVKELLVRRADDALLAINAGLFEQLEAFRWPTIALVDGPALGGGCELALACDLRLATPRSRFGQPETGLGILAGAGGNWRLPQLVGVGLARRMLYAGEQLDGAAAADAGLVDGIHAPESLMTAGRDLAGRISRQSWRALELTKLALRLNRPATTMFDLAAQALLFESDDKRARMEVFLERKKGSEPT